MNRVRIVTPVYNDWVSFAQLLTDLNKVAAALPFQIHITAVNDGSSEPVYPTLAS